MPALLELDLAAARATWFFEWFHLLPATEERPASGRLVRFRPEGGAFRDRVALDLALDEAQHLTAITLGLDRRFIEDPDDGGYARDIAQSFLRAVAPQPAEAVRQLADEVSEPEQPDAEPSECGRVFLGAAAEAALKGPGWRIALRNLMIGPDYWLLISAEKAAHAP
jgi:hypothetical protein